MFNLPKSSRWIEGEIWTVISRLFLVFADSNQVAVNIFERLVWFVNAQQSGLLKSFPILHVPSYSYKKNSSENWYENFNMKWLIWNGSRVSCHNFLPGKMILSADEFLIEASESFNCFLSISSWIIPCKSCHKSLLWFIIQPWLTILE